MDEELAIGIDLGTTYSCMAVLRNDQVEIIPNEIGEKLTPSIVSFTEDNKILVGEETKNLLINNPKKTIYSIKRLMGKDYKDKEVQNDLKAKFWSYDIVEKALRPAVRIENNQHMKKDYFPEQISSYILQKLIKSAREYLKQPVTKAVITIPAYFNNSQREATKLAAEAAGINVLKIINEPTAASLAYGLEKNIKLKQSFMNININDILKKEKKKIVKKEEGLIDDDKLIIVFDLGGGTLDVTLLKIEDNEIFTVLSTSGNPHLGGDDFDKKITEYCLEKFCSRFNYNPKDIQKDIKAMNRLKIASENAKLKLSYDNETEIYIDEFYNGELLQIQLTRQKFEEICRILFNRLINPIDRVLEDNDIGPSNIKEVVLVGGSTRIPRVKEVIQNFFYNSTINDSINPDETVAYGAAIEAAKINKHGCDILNDIILMDITPFSLGTNIINENENQEIQKKGDLMSVVIPRGTQIPVTKVKGYQTAFDYQKFIVIQIYEGENKYVKDNHYLGELRLENIPIKKKGEVKDDVEFSIDQNGILTVTAVETSKGITDKIKIINDKGFNEKQILNNIDNTYTIQTPTGNSSQIQNFKREMNYFFDEFNNTYNIEEKYKYLSSFCEVLQKYLYNFDKDGNDTLGNKYFIYIKILFKSYGVLLQIKKKVSNEDKDKIIKNSKYFIDILSQFKNINYTNYIDLLKLFPLKLTEEEEKIESAEGKLDIIEFRNSIIFELVTYVIEILSKKGETILLSSKKFSKYYSKEIFQNCLTISELFIKFERELGKFPDIKKRHDSCLEKCRNEIKKINRDFYVEFDKLKKSGKLINNLQNKSREELLILLDNFIQSYQSAKGIDLECEAFLLGNIVKLKYEFLKNQNFERLFRLSEQALSVELNEKIKKSEWYIELVNLSKLLKVKFEEQQKIENANNFEEKIQNEKKAIFDEIEKYKKKTNIEFIEFILEKYPPRKSPLKNNKTVKESYEKNPKGFLQILTARYNVENYKKDTDDEKLKYTIYLVIFKELNSMLSNLDNNKKIELDD